MKKLFICALALSLFSTPVLARPFHHGGHYHRPAKVIVHHSHHGEPLLAVASGLIGFAVGTATANAAQPVYTNYVAQDDKQCFVVVSKSSGNITQRCVNGDNQVLYVD